MNRFVFKLLVPSINIFVLFILLILTLIIVLGATIYFEDIYLKILIPLTTIIFYIVALYIYYGKLYIDVDDLKITFSWDRKKIFNHPTIDSLSLSEIKVITVIEDNIIQLRSDKTVVQLSGIKQFNKDSAGLLRLLSNKTSARIVDANEFVKEKGVSDNEKKYLKVLYGLATIFLIGIPIMLILFLIKNGLNQLAPEKVLYLLGAYSALLISRNRVKGMIK